MSFLKKNSYPFDLLDNMKIILLQGEFSGLMYQEQKHLKDPAIKCFNFHLFFAY